MNMNRLLYNITTTICEHFCEIPLPKIPLKPGSPLKPLITIEGLGFQNPHRGYLTAKGNRLQTTIVAVRNIAITLTITFTRSIVMTVAITITITITVTMPFLKVQLLRSAAAAAGVLSKSYVMASSGGDVRLGSDTVDTKSRA